MPTKFTLTGIFGPTSHPQTPPRRSFVRRAAVAAISICLVGSLFLISPFSASLVQIPRSNALDGYVFIGDLESGHCYRDAITRCKSGSINGVLLHAGDAQRLELLGATLPTREVLRRKLVADGLDEAAIQVIEGVAKSEFEAARLLDDWLETHPDTRVLLVCDAFSSRRWSVILHRNLSESQRLRVSIEGVSDPRYTGTNWWRSRSGIKAYFFSLFRLCYTSWIGEDRRPAIDWSVEKYESAALKHQ